MLLLRKMSLLIINCGSSSLKFQLLSGLDRPVAQGQVTGIGSDLTFLEYQMAGGTPSKSACTCPTYRDAVRTALHLLTSRRDIHAVGHRLLVGFPRFQQSILLDDRTVEKLTHLANTAISTHHELECVQACRELLPEVPHIGVFDSAFHRTLPPKAYLYGIPYEQYQQHGIRRWGFHGLSHESVSERFAPRKVISCHLGSGASVCAIEEGRSIETSMGFSTLEGLMMGTRCGDLDVGVIFELMRWQQLDATQAGEILSHRGGLLGVSGASADIRAVLAACLAGNERAWLAVDVFCHRVRKYIGAYWALLNGCDVLVFTGGIGEHLAEIRSRICESLDRLGIRLDPGANDGATGDTLISIEGAGTQVWVIASNEERMIAREVEEWITTRGVVQQ